MSPTRTTVTRAELKGFTGQTLPDLVGPEVRLLFVGINPGLRAVAVQAHFGGGSNRFYPALYRAGITRQQISASNGFKPEDLAELKQRGIGITSLVARASARADELSPAELREGAVLLDERVRMIGPTIVAMLGITAYRAAFGRPKAVVGPQPETLGGAPLWVVPNPSGLNAHAPLAVLAATYREVAIAAGIAVYDPPTV
ncbi:mismatch-specific DNA-glycosylase [Subtercola endophyticus]|uniref:mismatch-specific DNA-glycosylase n=1 Tax=Subtercola endophyticus TaxID=2895559 RepID=UPI001E368CEC|nr:mismatch-specific DNA-glycosylase [Subtercola endophyticus]UFS58846.1 mismatch-specific DNA-glycosylase [Subtercola endophyticus]